MILIDRIRPCLPHPRSRQPASTNFMQQHVLPSRKNSIFASTGWHFRLLQQTSLVSSFSLSTTFWPHQNRPYVHHLNRVHLDALQSLRAVVRCQHVTTCFFRFPSSSCSISFLHAFCFALRVNQFIILFCTNFPEPRLTAFHLCYPTRHVAHLEFY